MQLEIQDTKILEHDRDNATVELTISDNEDLETAKEYVLVRVQVSLVDSYLPSLQVDAMHRAKNLLQETEKSLKQKWNT